MMQPAQERVVSYGAPPRVGAEWAPEERQQPGRGGQTLWQEMARRWTAAGRFAVQSAAAPSSASASAGRGRSESRAWICP